MYDKYILPHENEKQQTVENILPQENKTNHLPSRKISTVKVKLPTKVMAPAKAKALTNWIKYEYIYK